MEVQAGSVLALGSGSATAPYQVSAVSFHPVRAEVSVAAAGLRGCELVEACAHSGEILARTRLERRVQHLRHQHVGTGGGRRSALTLLVLAYDDGNVEVWDAETRAVKARLTPPKKEEGRAVTALATTAGGSAATIYCVRGDSAIERTELGTGKTFRVDLRSARITSISAPPQPVTGPIAVGLAEGKVRLLDAKSLATRVSLAPKSAAELKGVPKAMVRSPVTSVSFNPHSANSMAATLQSGVVLFWDIHRAALDDFCIVRSDKSTLIQGQFHPFLPLFLTLSQGSTGALLDLWLLPTSQDPVKLGPSHRTPIPEGITAAVCGGEGLPAHVEAHTVCASMHFQPRQNVFCVLRTPQRGGLRDSKDAACSSRQSVMALFRLIDRRHAGALLALCSSLAPPTLLPDGGEAWHDERVVVVAGCSISVHSLLAAKTRECVQLLGVSDGCGGMLLGPYARAVHVSWVPVCGLALVAMTSGGATVAAPATPECLLDKISVAAVVLDDGAGGAGGGGNAQVACVMACRDAAVLLAPADGAGQGAPDAVLLLLSLDGRMLQRVSVGDSKCAPTRERADGGSATGGIGGSTSRLRVSLDKLRGLGRIGPQDWQSGVPVPSDVVLSQIWARSLPPRLCNPDAGTGGGVGFGWADVAGWDVKGQRVIGFSLLQAGGAVTYETMLALVPGEAIVQVAWEVQGGGCQGALQPLGGGLAVLTTERVAVLRRDTARGAMNVWPGWRVVAEVVEPGLESFLWVGSSVMFSSAASIRVLHVSEARSAAEGRPHRGTDDTIQKFRGSQVDTVCSLTTYGGVLAAVLSDRVVYVALDAGVPVVVTRPVGLLQLLLASQAHQVQGGGREEAKRVLGKYDWQRCSPAVLASMCDQGQEKIAWALAQHMTWLPLQHLLGLAFRCAKYRHCLSLLDSMARAGAGSLRALAERYKEVGHACVARGALATAAQAFVRAGLCGSEECLWTLYELVDGYDDTRAVASLLAIASKCEIPYLRVMCAHRLGLDISHHLRAHDRGGVGVRGEVGGWWERWGGVLPWEALLGSESAVISTGVEGGGGAQSAATCWHSLCDCVPEETGLDAAVRNENGGALAVDAVSFVDRTACGKVWAGNIEKHAADISLDGFRTWLGWNSADGPGNDGGGNARSEYTESDRDTEDVQEANGAGIQRPPEVDAEGYSLRPSEALNVGRSGRHLHPVGRDQWSDSEGEEGNGDEEAEEELKPVIRVAIRSADEVEKDMQEDPEALRKIMQQMTVTNPDAATAAQAPGPGVLDIGVGSTSLFAGKSRRRTVASLPSPQAPATPSVRDTSSNVAANRRQTLPPAYSHLPLPSPPGSDGPESTRGNVLQEPVALSGQTAHQAVDSGPGSSADFGDFDAGPLTRDPFGAASLGPAESSFSTSEPFNADPFTAFPAPSASVAPENAEGESGADPFADPFAAFTAATFTEDPFAQQSAQGPLMAADASLQEAAASRHDATAPESPDAWAQVAFAPLPASEHSDLQVSSTNADQGEWKAAFPSSSSSRSADAEPAAEEAPEPDGWLQFSDKVENVEEDDANAWSAAHFSSASSTKSSASAAGRPTSTNSGATLQLQPEAMQSKAGADGLGETDGACIEGLDSSAEVAAWAAEAVVEMSSDDGDMVSSISPSLLSLRNEECVQESTVEMTEGLPAQLTQEVATEAVCASPQAAADISGVTLPSSPGLHATTEKRGDEICAVDALDSVDTRIMAPAALLVENVAARAAVVQVEGDVLTRNQPTVSPEAQEGGGGGLPSNVAEEVMDTEEPTLIGMTAASSAAQPAAEDATEEVAKDTAASAGGLTTGASTLPSPLLAPPQLQVASLPRGARDRRSQLNRLEAEMKLLEVEESHQLETGILGRRPMQQLRHDLCASDPAGAAAGFTAVADVDLDGTLQTKRTHPTDAADVNFAAATFDEGTGWIAFSEGGESDNDAGFG